jgi:hypothetical protein
MLDNANPPAYQMRQEVIQYGLQTFLFHLKDMHTLTLKIEEDIQFQRGLNVKQNLEFLFLTSIIF